MNIPSPAIRMPGVGSQIPLSNETFVLLRDFIYAQTGIYFQDSKKYLLEGRVGKRVQLLNLPGFEAYVNLLKFGNSRNEEMRYFYDAITINETSFFRNEPQFDAFVRSLVPDILERKQTNGRTKLRVWSAASSSGEEAHTLAMIFLEQLLPKYPTLELEIFGSDISHSVLDIARKGVYRDYSIRNMPKQYLDKYFIVDEARYHLRDEVKRLVRFEHVNLSDQTRMRQIIGFDIIFCCNVLIYFDTRSKVQVVSNLYDGLNKGGYLFIGYAESLHGISTAFKLVSFPKTVAYKKEQ